MSTVKSEKIDILNSPFFKHLFFDSYVLKDDGYIPEISCEIFSTYLKNEDIKNEFTNQFNRNIYKDHIIDQEFTYEKLLHSIVTNPELFKKYNKFVLLSGYSISTRGHSVVFYIEKELDDLYKLSIVNSGEGLDYHPINIKKTDISGGGKFRGNSSSKYSVMLQYNNVNFNIIINLINFTYLMRDLKIRNELKNYLNLMDKLKYSLKTDDYTNSLYDIENPLLIERKDYEFYNSGTIWIERCKNLKDIIKSDSEYENLKRLLTEDEYNIVMYEEEIEKMINKCKKKEREQCIKKYFSFIEDLLLKDSKFNIFDGVVDIDLFYQYLKKIIVNFDSPNEFINDNPQESGSCSFYSVYYTLKFFFFTNDTLFNNFINTIKLDLLHHLKDTLIKKSKINPDINLVNSALLLVKNYSKDILFKSIIKKIKNIITNLYENDFYKEKHHTTISRSKQKINIKKINGQNEYMFFLENINVTSYTNLLDKLKNMISHKDKDENILIFYILHKSTILFINTLNHIKINTTDDFILFYKTIKLVCSSLISIEIKNIEFFREETNSILQNLIFNIKLKLLEKFLFILYPFNLITLTDNTINIFDESQIITNKTKIWQFIFQANIKTLDYDFDFEQLFGLLFNKYELIVKKTFFENCDNDGELLYLLGFTYFMEKKYKFLERGGNHYRKKYIKMGNEIHFLQKGGYYGFDFIKYYSLFKKKYENTDYDTENKISYNNMTHKTVNKKFVNLIKNLGDTKILYYDNTDLTNINILIDSINASDKNNIMNNSELLIYTNTTQVDFILYLPEPSNDIYYEKIEEYYFAVKKNRNTNAKYIIPTLIHKIKIDKFIENISLISEQCIDTIAFLLYKYRKDDYEKYKINDFLSDTSYFKIISSNNKELYKIFFYILRTENLLYYNDDIKSFYKVKNNLTNYGNRRSLSFIYYVMEYIGYEKINDTELFNSIQKVFDEFAINSNIVGNYKLLENDFFNNELIVFENMITKKMYYKLEKGDKLYEFLIDSYDMSIHKFFIFEDFELIKNKGSIVLPEKLSIFIKNLSSVSVNFLWKTYDRIESVWLIELVEFNKNLQFIYYEEDESLYCYDNDDKYLVVTKYNKIMGMLVYDSPNSLILTKNDKYYFLLMNSAEYYNKIKINTQFYWINFSQEIEPYIPENCYYIYEINCNFLTFSVKTDDYKNLMFSFFYNKNNYGIFLIMENFKNIIQNVNLAEIFCDVPFARLYNNNFLKQKTLNINFNYKDITKIIHNKFIIELDNINKFNIDTINNISDKINSIKNIVYGNTQQHIINNNDEIKTYISEYRANCKKEYFELKDYIEKVVLIPNDNINTYLDDIFEHIICKKKINTFPSLYVKKFNLFYNILISNLYHICITELKKLLLFSCDELLKRIVLLDKHEIYPISEPRNIEDILFELHTNFFIKREQKTLVENNILMDLVSNTNNKVYEILMGKGKTTTITPLILINQIFTTSIKNYTIILPKHLVPPSIDIIKKYSQIFYNYNINSIVNSDIKNDHVISIISDVSLKKFILKKITELTKIDMLFNTNNLFIFDEIDTLIDSNKSELNMPSDNKSHDYSKFIFKNITNIVQNYYEHKDTDFNKLLIYEEEDKEIVCIFKDKMKKIFELVDTMIYNQTYGFGKLTIGSMSVIQKNKNNFIAVPYSANNTPLIKSEFTDFELAITLTILSFLNNGLRPEDLFILFRHFIKILAADFNLKFFLPDFITSDVLNDIIKVSKYNDDYLLEWCRLKITFYSKIKNIIIYYLKEIIFPKYFEISVKQYNISMVDLLDDSICKKKISFSGTVNFYLLSDIAKSVIKNYGEYKKNHLQFNNNLLSEIIPDLKSKGSIYSAIYGVTTQLSKIILYEGDFNYVLMENNFIDVILNADNLIKYDAIIDVAGLIINKSSLQIIEIVF